LEVFLLKLLQDEHYFGISTKPKASNKTKKKFTNWVLMIINQTLKNICMYFFFRSLKLMMGSSLAELSAKKYLLCVRNI
jgi:hypothetical protein